MEGGAEFKAVLNTMSLWPLPKVLLLLDSQLAHTRGDLRMASLRIRSWLTFSSQGPEIFWGFEVSIISTHTCAAAGRKRPQMTGESKGG